MTLRTATGASCPCFPSMVSGNRSFWAYDMSCMLFCEIISSVCLALVVWLQLERHFCRQPQSKSCLTQEPTLPDKQISPIKHLQGQNSSCVFEGRRRQRRLPWLCRCGGDAWMHAAAAGVQQPGALGAGAGALCRCPIHRPPSRGEGLSC